jgi:uncharacterized protein YraI
MNKLLVLLVVVLALLLAPMAATAATAPSTAQAQGASISASQTAKVSAPAGLRLRTGPGLGHAVILAMHHGETVHITGAPVWSHGISWTPVLYHRWGRTHHGYSASKYLVPAVHVPPPVTGLRVVPWAGLHLRWGPGTWFGVYRAVPRGTILQPTGVYRWGGGILWAQVRYHGFHLWAASAHLTPA